MRASPLLKQGPDGIDEDSGLYADAVRNISWYEDSVLILSPLINLSQCGLNLFQFVFESSKKKRCSYGLLESCLARDFVYCFGVKQQPNKKTKVGLSISQVKVYKYHLFNSG